MGVAGCVVCGRAEYAVVSIAGGLWEPYAVCFDHRHHDRRAARDFGHTFVKGK